MKNSTKQAIQELRKETGFNILKARQYKGSMKTYIHFEVELNGIQ